MEFRVLGPLRVLDQGQELPTGSPRIRAVLGILLARQGGVVSVDQFVDELWPERPPRDARALVHGYVSRLRRALGAGPGGAAAAGCVMTRKPGYLLRIEPDELDLHRYQKIIGRARATQSIAVFREADRLWTGEPFADVPRTPMIAATAAGFAEARLADLEEQFDIALGSGHAARVVVELSEHVAAHPLRERLVGQLMLALYHTGRKADALATYDAVRMRLAEELGVDPGPPLRDLQIAILRDSAEHSAPSHQDAAWPPGQLPPDLSTFIGRDGELAQLLAPHGPGNEARTVVISALDGMAGVGKPNPG